MYAESSHYYQAQRKKDRIRGYLKKAVLVVTVICIIIVCMAAAVQTKASQVVAAEAEAAQGVTAGTESAGDGNAGAENAESGDTGAENAEDGDADTENAADGDTDTENASDEGADAEDTGEEAAAEGGVIVLDPGHGGRDGGCVCGGVLEKDINLKIAQRTALLLREQGYQVVLTREGDEWIDKAERVESANERKAAVYVSIHQNSCELADVSGIETWYGENDLTESSQKLAQLIEKAVVRATDANERELVADDELCVVNRSRMPSCLIETGFLSNKEERKKLCSDEYQEKIASGIAEGIVSYLNL